MRLIAARRADGRDSGDALSTLLASRDAERGQELDDRQVRDEAMTLFLAGHETTANALTWTCYLLSEHPAVEARLHRELFEVDVDPIATEAAEAFPCTIAVLREAMRLYPPEWLIGRRSPEDVEIGPYRLPLRSTVLLSPLVARLPHCTDAPTISFPSVGCKARRRRPLPTSHLAPELGGASASGSLGRKCWSSSLRWGESTDFSGRRRISSGRTPSSRYDLGTCGDAPRSQRGQIMKAMTAVTETSRWPRMWRSQA